MSQPTLVGHRLAPRCSEAVQFSTLTTKLFFLSLLRCSPPSSCSQAWKRVHPYPKAWEPPVLSLSIIILFLLFRFASYAPCECWARTAEEKWRLSTAYIGWFFPLAHSSGCLWPDCFLPSVLTLFCCLWIGERMTLNLLFLRVVTTPLNLKDNKIKAGNSYHFIIFCPSQVHLTAFLGIRCGTRAKRSMFFILIFKKKPPL